MNQVCAEQPSRDGLVPRRPEVVKPFGGSRRLDAKDDDLKAVFAYLRQIPAIRNKVPDPIPPNP